MLKSSACPLEESSPSTYNATPWCPARYVTVLFHSLFSVCGVLGVRQMDKLLAALLGVRDPHYFGVGPVQTSRGSRSQSGRSRGRRRRRKSRLVVAVWKEKAGRNVGHEGRNQGEGRDDTARNT